MPLSAVDYHRGVKQRNFFAELKHRGYNEVLGYRVRDRTRDTDLVNQCSAGPLGRRQGVHGQWRARASPDMSLVDLCCGRARQFLQWARTKDLSGEEPMRVFVTFLVVLSVVLSGCAQLTTNERERAELEAAAKKTGDAYVECIVQASERYAQTGESSGVIIEVSKKACGEARSAFAAADTPYVNSKYMVTEPVVAKDLAALDERATKLVEERVLERKAAAPAAAAIATPAAMAAAATAAGDGKRYLDCMRAQGERYASVKEPAEVVAEVAHSRCASALTDPATSAQLEREGRALVMGLVLDRKVGP